MTAADNKKISFDVKNVDLWSAESPTLYSLMLTVLDNEQRPAEYIPWQFGFRESVIKDNQYWVNGKSIKIKGVNRHEHHPRTGRYVDLATMELDIKLMKQGNFNLVRTSHYPNDHRWYQLANQYGMYVLDDANQESHGYKTRNKILGDNPEWTKAHVDRAVSMVHTNKNYTSVVIWSLGNEGGAGQNFRAMKDAVLAIDTSRPILSDTDKEVSDFTERSYRTLEGKNNVDEFIVISEQTNKPFIQREYAHAMGNSLGNFKEHWDKIYATENYVGGAIWDWVDQGLARVKNTAMVSYGEQPSKLTLNPNREVWSYGGDFGDLPTDAEFLLNGIVSPDRKPYPAFYEAQRVQQNVWFEQTQDPSVIKVSNRFDFTDLAEFDFHWQVKARNKVLNKGSFSLALAAKQSTTVTIPFDVKSYAGQGELLLEVSAHLKQDELWADSGFAIAQAQFIVQPYVFETAIAAKGKPLRVEHTSENISIVTATNSLMVDAVSGELTSIVHQGDELFSQPLAPYFWKPVNNNQSRNKYVERLSPWINAAAYRQVKSVKVTELADNLVKVAVEARLVVNNALLITEYVINGAGEVHVALNYQPDEDRIQHKYMPKFGVRFGLNERLASISWYGKGPFENYPDRQTAANIGDYQSSLAAFQVPYISATDSTNRTQVRELSFADNVSKLVISAGQPLNFRAWPYNESDLYSTNDIHDKFSESARVRRKHSYELPSRGYINVNLDSEIYGVGGDNSWGAQTMKKYRVRADKPHAMSFFITTIAQ